VAIRRRAISPDTYIDTETYGRLPCVSDQAFLEAVLAGAQTQALAGGVLSVLVERHPTDLPEESITLRGIIEWRNRTDARPQREPVDRPASIVDDIHEEPVETEPLPEISDDQLTIDADGDPETDPEREPEEDLSSIPVEMR
jgi:hypothetical protein